MTHSYPNFDKATKLATQLLCHQDLSNRMLDVETLTYDKPIVFDSLQNYSSLTNIPIERLASKKSPTGDGVCIYDNKAGIYIVLYNSSDKNIAHRNWSVAHEVGHIYLDHKADGDIEEIEAHYFASQLLMPEYTLHMIQKEYGNIQPIDIVEIFGVSKKAAEKRLRSFNKMGVINAGSKDVAIWEKQKDKIDLYFCCKKSGDDFRFIFDILNFSPTSSLKIN